MKCIMSMASIVSSCCQSKAADLRSKADAHGSDNKRLVAKVYVTTKLPTLVLEDIDHHLGEVLCSESFVTVSFATAAAKYIALQDLTLHETFYLITSHGTCNEDGERRVYL